MRTELQEHVAKAIAQADGLKGCLEVWPACLNEMNNAERAEHGYTAPLNPVACRCWMRAYAALAALGALLAETTETTGRNAVS